MNDAIDLKHTNTIPFTEAQMSNLADMYEGKRMSLRQISAVYGISQRSVIRRLVTMGVQLRGRGREKGCVSWRVQA